MNLNNLNLNEKIEDLLAALKKKEDEKEKNTVLWVLAIIGAVAAVAGIAFAVRLSPVRERHVSMGCLTLMHFLRKSTDVFMKDFRMLPCHTNSKLQ